MKIDQNRTEVFDDETRCVGDILFYSDYNEYFFQPRQEIMYNEHLIFGVHDFLQIMNKERKKHEMSVKK